MRSCLAYGLQGVARIQTDGKLKTINFFAFPPFMRARFSSPMLPARDPGLYEMVYEPASFEIKNRISNLMSFKWLIRDNTIDIHMITLDISSNISQHKC